MRELGIAVIGRGVWGCHSLEQEMLKCAGTKVIGVHTADRWGESSFPGAPEETGRRYAADLHTDYYSDWRSLILDPRVDVVSLMAAPHARVEPAVLAMTHGKYVVVDKPLAATTAAADRLAAFEREAPGKGFVLCGLQYEEKVRRLGEAIRAGTLGDLVAVRVLLHFTGGVFPGFVPSVRYAQGTVGGELTVIGTHALHTLLWLCAGQQVKSVYARRCNHFYPSYARVGLEDWAETVIRFSSGAVGSVYVTRVPFKPAIQPEVIEVTGTGGFARVTADRLTVWPGGSEVMETMSPAERLKSTFEQVLAAVRERRPTPMSFQDGARLNHLLEAAYSSATSGGAVVVNV